MARILVIDDDDALRDMLALSLTTAGHEVVTADNGMKGLQLYRAEPTDVVLIDLMMPHDGLMAIRVIRSQFPELAIIAMSGGGAHRLAYARTLGAQATLAKPFSRAELASAIDAVLGQEALAESGPATSADLGLRVA